MLVVIHRLAQVAVVEEQDQQEKMGLHKVHPVVFIWVAVVQL
jgi:hypothetical protein